MPAVSQALTGAVPAAVSPDWLDVDTAPVIGPAQYGSPQAAPAAPPVPTAAPQVEPGSTPQPPAAGVMHVSPDGAWPILTQGGLLPQGPVDRGDGGPQRADLAEMPGAPAPGMWAAAEPLQTYDAVAQSTDTHGWLQNVPNDRVSERRTFGQDNAANHEWWWDPAENPALAHTAITATDITSDGFYGSDGTLPDMWVPEGESFAYDTPAPPASTTPTSTFDTDPGSIYG